MPPSPFLSFSPPFCSLSPFLLPSPSLPPLLPPSPSHSFHAVSFASLLCLPSLPSPLLPLYLSLSPLPLLTYPSSCPSFPIFFTPLSLPSLRSSISLLRSPFPPLSLLLTSACHFFPCSFLFLMILDMSPFLPSFLLLPEPSLLFPSTSLPSPSPLPLLLTPFLLHPFLTIFSPFLPLSCLLTCLFSPPPLRLSPRQHTSWAIFATAEVQKSLAQNLP